MRCFPDKLPIGIEKDSTDHLVFLYLVNRRLPVDFRQFLIRHARPVALRAHVDRAAARPTPLQEGRRALQSRPPRGALDADESQRHQDAGDVLSRASGTGRTPRRSGRSLHPGRVPEAGDVEDPGALSSVATTTATACSGRRTRPRLRDDHSHGCSAIEVELLNRQYLQLTGTMDRDVWAKRGAKRKSRQVGPPFRRPLQTLSHPWLPMSANRRQMLEAAHVAACTTTRRRSLPPRPRVPVPMSLHQRWRERPRCRALHLTPGVPGRGRSRHRWSCRVSLSACPVRAGESRRPRAHVRAQMRPQKRADAFRRNRFAHEPVLPQNTHAFCVADRAAPPSRR